MRTKTAFSLAALVLAILALAVPAAALAERTVSVEATATIKVPNDSAAVGLGVTLERGSRGAALQATSAKLRKVIAAVRKFPGVGDGDVETGRVSVRRIESDPDRYRASEGISVTLHEPSKAGDLINAAVAAGATGVRGPTFFVGDTEAAFSNALGAAFDKAKAKARTLAARAGATLGEALAINEGGGAEILPYQEKAASGDEAAACAAPESSTGTSSQPAPVTAKRTESSASVCAAPSPPTKPGRSTVTATVGVVFALL